MNNRATFISAVSVLGIFPYPLSLHAESLHAESLYAENIQTQSNLPEIIVTATRTANSVDETIAPVTIFTREDIERSQATSVIDVLRTAPGISFTSNGGMGGTSGISIRGTNTDHVLYLIDGVPIRSATSGNTAIQYIPVAQIERIEIVRGPRSSLYGSDAIGGVIQIFTKKDEKDKFTASMGYGSDDTKELTASYSGGDEKSHYNAAVSALESNGYDFYGYAYDPAAYATVYSEIDQDNDGYENYSLSLNGSHKINDRLSLSGVYLRSQGENQFDGYFNKNTHTDFMQQLLSGSLDFSVSEDWNTQLKLSRNYDKQYNQLEQASSKTRFNTRTDVINWQNDILIRDMDLLTLGLDYKEDKVDSSDDFSEDSRWNQAAFAQYQYEGDFFNTQLSYRYDDNEAFGSHNTWNFATGFSLDERVRITTSYGTAFKAPTFNDLYYPDTGWYKGNPNLKPEESESFDFGVEISTGQTLWTAHYFNTRINNLISYVYSFPVSTMENVSKAKIDGFELTVDTELYGFKLSGNASYVNPIDRSTGKMLPNRSKNNFNLSIDKDINSFSYGASLIASSERYNTKEEQQQLPGFGLVNIRASWDIDKHWTLKAKIDNLFDKDYVLTRDFDGNDYNQPDRFAFASIHYEM